MSVVNPPFSSDTTVKTLLDRYPQLLQVFMELGLLCAGCPVEAFHTLDDVAREYHLDGGQLRQRLEQVLEADASSQGLQTAKYFSKGE